MSDNVTLPGTGAVIASDDVGGAQIQRVKVGVGADGSSTDLAFGQATKANSLPVTLASNEDALPVTDNAGSLTVDSPQLPAALAAGGGLKIEGVAGGVVVPVSDGGGSLTVDGSVSVSGAVDSELTTADVDTGAGTDTRAVVGIVGTASGGGQLIPGSSTDGLLVNLGANNDVTVTSGTVTANAGTNLNTSALALESGGNLAAAAASLSVLDDWDETDRAKVNPIAGQAGVQGASGVVTALTQRVVLATDVALP